ncbi:MAG: VWA domain-containing protein [Deltaproteobacteria bacterium]|nr:VWA domain-containing protein [Deltaproteobacteria bacterium]
MTTRGYAGLAALIALGTAQSAMAQSTWLGGEGSFGRVASSSSSAEQHLGIWVEVPANAAAAARLPMALSLVIDTSGSMSGAKIEHAREAALRFVDTLQPGDLVSIYAFHTTVDEIVAPTQIAPGVRETLAPRIRALTARGNTNMHAGLARGQQALATAPPTHRIRRVVLISDGRATVQPTSAEALGQLAAEGARRQVAVAAIGVGADYDERSLRELAVRSAGRLYHVDDTAELATVVTAEVGLLGRSAATNARVEVVPAPGVTLVAAETIGGRVEGGRAAFEIGTMFAPQSREYLVRVRVPSSNVGRFPLAHVVLRYEGVGSSAGERREDVFLSYEVSPDLVAVQASESSRVSAMIALQASASSQLAAGERAGRGRRDEADQQLAQAQQRVRQAAARSRDGATRARLQREDQSIQRRRAVIQEARQPAAARAAGRRVSSEALDAWY